MATKIPWTDETWNPAVGCTKVSEGCKNCYAEKMAHRLACMELADCQYSPFTAADRKYYSVVSDGKWNGKVYCDESALEIPLHWRKPRRIFVCSMSDLFHPKVPFEFIDKVWDIINISRQHTYQILTKRPNRVLEYVKHIESFRFHSNVWPGATCENQRTADERIPILLQIPAAVRFVSLEPLLEQIAVFRWVSGDWIYFNGNMKFDHIDWVIIGCESGPKRRECKIAWVRDIVNQCKEAQVPVFVKQLSINGKVSKDPKEWPEDLRIQDFPKGGAK